MVYYGILLTPAKCFEILLGSKIDTGKKHEKRKNRYHNNANKTGHAPPEHDVLFVIRII
jgi:hypothetical protein